MEKAKSILVHFVVCSHPIIIDDDDDDSNEYDDCYLKYETKKIWFRTWKSFDWTCFQTAVIWTEWEEKMFCLMLLSRENKPDNLTTTEKNHKKSWMQIGAAAERNGKS